MRLNEKKIEQTKNPNDNNWVHLHTIQQQEQKIFDSLFSIAKIVENKDISQESKNIFCHTCNNIYNSIQKEKV